MLQSFHGEICYNASNGCTTGLLAVLHDRVT